jgi:hypothetical protein
VLEIPSPEDNEERLNVASDRFERGVRQWFVGRLPADCVVDWIEENNVEPETDILIDTGKELWIGEMKLRTEGDTLDEEAALTAIKKQLPRRVKWFGESRGRSIREVVITNAEKVPTVLSEWMQERQPRAVWQVVLDRSVQEFIDSDDSLVLDVRDLFTRASVDTEYLRTEVME